MENLSSLPITERLDVLEAALRSIRNEEHTKEQEAMRQAAERMRAEYLCNPDLTALN